MSEYSMQKLLIELEIEEAKISTKGLQRLIIIPKTLHHTLSKIEDKEYLICITILEGSEKKLSLQIIGKISQMSVEPQIIIPKKLHKELAKLKDKKYKIRISIQEI